jgi:hypothetical protein
MKNHKSERRHKTEPEPSVREFSQGELQSELDELARDTMDERHYELRRARALALAQRRFERETDD